MAKLFILIAIAVIALLAVNWFIKTPPKQAARAMKRAGWMVGGVVLILLAATGRLAWFFALIGSFIAFLPRLAPLLRYIPILAQLVRWLQSHGALGAQPSLGGRPGESTVQSQFLRMALNHSSGEINGEVLAGKFIGKWLHELAIEQLLALYEELHGDNDSRALFEAYMDRIHPDWRDTSDQAGAQYESAHPSSGAMSLSEALAVLGLEEGPSKREIIRAHRKLMQKMHPDRGGSDFLAAKINQAKDVLLEHLAAN